MCMMKNSGEKEACEVANNLAALDGRVTKVEERMNKIEGSLNDGFKSLSVSISNLGHDVGSRVNLIEKKVVDEKAEWGKTLRKVVLWSAATEYEREVWKKLLDSLSVPNTEN